MNESLFFPFFFPVFVVVAFGFFTCVLIIWCYRIRFTFRTNDKVNLRNCSFTSTSDAGDPTLKSLDDHYELEASTPFHLNKVKPQWN